jgi:hypothetical protein
VRFHASFSHDSRQKESYPGTPSPPPELLQRVRYMSNPGGGPPPLQYQPHVPFPPPFQTQFLCPPNMPNIPNIPPPIPQQLPPYTGYSAPGYIPVHSFSAPNLMYSSYAPSYAPSYPPSASMTMSFPLASPGSPGSFYVISDPSHPVHPVYYNSSAPNYPHNYHA